MEIIKKYVVLILVFAIAVKNDMEWLAMLSFVTFVIGLEDVRKFLKNMMIKIERSKKCKISKDGFEFQEGEAMPISSSSVEEKESSVSADKFTQYFLEGNFALSQQKDYDKAKEKFEKAVEIDDNDYQTHVSLGLVYSILGDNDNSIKHSKKALELKPSSFVPQFNFAVAINHKYDSKHSLPEYMKAEKYAEEEKLSRVSIIIGKLNLFLGHDYRQLGDKEEACKRYDRAEEIFRVYNTPESWHWLQETYEGIEMNERR